MAEGSPTKMKLLITGDIGTDQSKKRELISLTKVVKPDYVILNGGILDNAESIDNSVELFRDVSKIKPILYHHCGLFETSKLRKDFDSEISKLSGIRDISASPIKIDEYFIYGINLIPNHAFRNKDFVRNESESSDIDQIYETCTLNDEIFDVDEFKNKMKKCKTIKEEILNKLNDGINFGKTIWITYAPPEKSGLDVYMHRIPCGSSDIKKFVDGEFTDKKQPFFVCSGYSKYLPSYTKKCSTKIDNCYCTITGQHGTGLDYILLIINHNKELIVYHPKYTINLTDSKTI